MRPARILFVRSGGGMPGLDIHAGIWMALAEAGVAATDCWGTSAGAVVSALDAYGVPAALAANTILQLADGDVRSERAAWKLRVPWIDSYLRPDPVLRLLRTLLPAGWEGFKKALHVYATRADSGAAEDGASAFAEPARAVLASMSICGAFPPVIGDDGQEYFDGGVAANLPAPRSAAAANAFSEIWLLVAAGRPRGYARASGMLTRLVQNARWMMHAQIVDAIRDCQDAAEFTMRGTRVRVLWPDLETTKGVLHFDHQLVQQARDWTRRALEKNKPGEQA